MGHHLVDILTIYGKTKDVDRRIPLYEYKQIYHYRYNYSSILIDIPTIQKHGWFTDSMNYRMKPLSNILSTISHIVGCRYNHYNPWSR